MLNMSKALNSALQQPGGLQVPDSVKRIEERLKNEYPIHKNCHIAAAKERERIKAATDNASKKPELSKPAIPETRPPPVPVAEVESESDSDGESMDTDTSDNESSVEAPINRFQMSYTARDEQLRTMIKLHDQHLKEEGPGNDVSGTWHLDCPSLTLKYCAHKARQHQKIVWNIHSEVDKVNRPSISWIKFDMIVVEGVIRIEALEFRKEYEGKKLPFTWRGRKTWDSRLLCDDVVNSGYVIFPSMHECWGVFSALGQEWLFTGKKVDRIVPSKSIYALRREYNNFLDCLRGKGR